MVEGDFGDECARAVVPATEDPLLVALVVVVGLRTRAHQWHLVPASVLWSYFLGRC